MRSTRLRRPSSGVAELSLVVEARTSWQAVELATTALDAAFAATGRAAVDWARVRPEVRAVPAPSRPVRRPRARARLSVPAPPSFPGWAEVAAETRRLTAPRRPLPGLAALVAVPGPAAVIDLR